MPLTDAIGRISKKHQLTLSTTSKLAFYSLQTKDFVFKLSDIKSGINSADARKYCLNGLGFLKIINSLENTDINQMLFTFLHISLQEFLAAFYVSTLSQCAQIWKQTFWKSEFLNVWTYYCGITGDNLLKNMLLGWFGIQNDILRNKIKCLYLVHCLMESPDSEIYQKIKPRVTANDVSLNLSLCTFTQEDFQILLLFLLRSKVQEWSSLDLSCCHIDDDNLIYFLQQLQSFVTSIPSIKGLNLPNNQLSRICLRNVFKMAVIFNTIKINLSGNEIEDQKICESVTFFTQSSVDQSRINIIQNCESFFLLRCHNVLQDIKLISNLAHLYIIRCSLVNETIDDLLNALESCSTLSSVFFYDNTLLHLDLLKLLDGLTVLKWLKSVLIFEKTSLDILYKSSFKFILLSNIAALACHHQLAVLLQLNDCHIIDDVMSQIAVILNSSSQHWSLLDLSGSRIDDNTWRKFCNALYGNCAVDNIKLASNELSSSSLIVKLIQCLNPNAIDICGNNFTTDDSNFALIVAEELFAHDKQLSLTLTCDSDIVLFCQKLNLNAITAKLNTSSNFTQLFINNCTLCSKILLNSIDNYDTLTSLYLVHVQWSGDPFYNFTEFFEKNIFFSICENIIPRQTFGFLVNKFNGDVSRIISTDDIFIANKCSYNMLKLHLIQKISPLSLNVNLFCILNCLLENEPQNSSIISDYLSKQNMVTEIMLCNNGLSPKNVHGIIKTLKQLKLRKSIFIYEHKQLYGTKVVKCLLHIFNCSFIIIEDKIVIGNQANLEQLSQCLSLVPTLTTILRFISCSFSNEHCNSLADVLSRNTTLEEFSLYECNTNDIWTKQLVEALQVKSALTSLLLSCNKVTPLKADSIATALSAVINNNHTLENVSFKFDNLPSSACGKIFQALSNVRHLKRFRFCDGQVTTKEAIDQLYKVITNNPSLKVVNLRNNKLQSSGIKAAAKAFENIHHLKLLALNGNQIDEEAADDIASIIANNIGIEKLLLYNNALKSEGICKVCQAMKCHTNLKVFRIGQNYIQEEAADDIAEVINHNPLLKVVDIANNRLLTNGVMKITRQLEKITNLQKVNLKENNITCTEKLAENIAKSFTNNTYLKVLHLDNNNFSVSDVSIIAEAINILTGLKELTVNNTGFTADHISTMITNNLLLEILDIGDNKLESEGISHISKALMKLSHLRELGLYGNEIIDDAAGDIAGVISRLPVLEKLWLSNNTLGVGGMQTICKSLQHNGTLKLLQLDNVGITEEVADDIAAVIDSNPLEYIYLGNNKLHSTGANVILNSLKNKTKFKALGLNNNCISEDVASE